MRSTEERTARSESSLQASTESLIPVLLALAFFLGWVGDSPPGLPQQFAAQDLAVLCYGCAALIWVLGTWKPWVGRWFITVAVLGLVFLSNRWLGVPGLLTLLCVPTTLAAVLLGLPASLAVGIAGTALLLVFPNQVAGDTTPGTVAAALIGIWATIGVLVAAYRPMVLHTRWLDEYFERARRMLEEARQRKAGMEQAVADVARANRQLALANQRIGALRLIAEDAQKTKAAFVAKVSHEFRTPLNLILGLVELMAQSSDIYDVELPFEMEKDLQVVLRNCRHLSSMIDDVLDLTRVETGHLTLHKERVDLVGVIDEAVQTVFPLAEKKGLALEIKAPSDLPLVYCDRVRIRQVVLNLLSNAARFTDEGRVTVSAAAQERHVVVRVTDTGPGIAPEEAERIFEPFCQGQTKLWRDKGGSGLGLSISREFIRRHQGRLWLESELGVGSSFIFELPISPPLEHPARPERWIRSDWVWREGTFRTDRSDLADRERKPRIVVSDPTGGLYSELARFHEEIDLVRVQDPPEVRQAVQACPADVVLVNAVAPGSLLPALDRMMPTAPGTLVVGCSVHRPDEPALSAGALGYLVKPVSHADLRQALQGTSNAVRRVLVVDDDPDVLQLLTRMLHTCDRGLEVDTAASGQEALEKHRSTPFDLILLDVLMPDMDGWQVLDHLVADKPAARPGILLVSGQDPTEQPPMTKVLVAGAGDGLSILKLLRCSLGMSALMLTPDRALDPMPQQTAQAEPAWRENAPRREPAQAHLP